MPTSTGILKKMETALDPSDNTVHYYMTLGEDRLHLNDFVGKEISISATNRKQCLGCSKNIRGKTYSGGFCYPCFISLPQCDMCMMKPETCHFDKGTCRDSDWGLKTCFKDHTLYLARSSGIKVGITRRVQQIHRWMDQGANEAVVIGVFENRKQVGDAETAISANMSDKTNWRRMLKNDITEEPFDSYIEQAKNALPPELQKYLLEEQEYYNFNYPVTAWPEKVKSFKLDKTPLYTEVLTGIKGQYLIFGNEVINIRTHGGYEISLSY